ncbi:MAG: Wzz/FepE/Etk N-terminal domain-containing protein [Clostridia bacterium]|nr:Wzz/FepE/Etk N-terminal domain-containing protein [Clostridia bacterium]
MQNFSFTYLLDLALKRIWILILAAIVFGVSAFAYSKLVLVPSYTASASIIVTNGSILTQSDKESQNSGSKSDEESISTYDINSSLSIARNIVEVLKSPNKYIKLAEYLDGDYSYKSLMNKSTISMRENGTFLVDIRFVSSNGNEAIKLANAYAELACKIVPLELKGVELAISSTAMSFSKTYPNELQNTAIFALLGFIIAYVTIFVIDILDPAIRGEAEFVEKYDVPLLGTVPDFDGISNTSYGKYGYGYGRNWKGGYLSEKKR